MPRHKQCKGHKDDYQLTRIALAIALCTTCDGRVDIPDSDMEGDTIHITHQNLRDGVTGEWHSFTVWRFEK